MPQAVQGLALTKHEPTIKAFDEVKWAELPDAKTGAIAPSLDLLDDLHHRWTFPLMDEAAGLSSLLTALCAV